MHCPGKSVPLLQHNPPVVLTSLDTRAASRAIKRIALANVVLQIVLPKPTMYQASVTGPMHVGQQQQKNQECWDSFQVIMYSPLKLLNLLKSQSKLIFDGKVSTEKKVDVGHMRHSIHVG